MPLLKEKTNVARSENIRRLRNEGRSVDQAAAIAYRIQRGKADGGEVDDPWAQGVRAAETGAIAPSPYDRDTRNMLAMGRAGDDLRNNAPLLMDTAPGRVTRAIGRAATGNTPYIGPGLRREDYTDDPEARQPIEPMINDAMNVADVMSLGSLPSVALKGAQRGALGIGVPPKKKFGLLKFPDKELYVHENGYHANGRLAHKYEEKKEGALLVSKSEASKKIKELEKITGSKLIFEPVQEPQHMADGGTPFFARQGASTLAHSGMIHSTVPGRTDQIPLGVKRNSFVVPADTVSSLGQGNSLAGARTLDHMFKSGPYGSALPNGKSTRVIRQKFAEGGNVEKSPVDIIAAGGEYVLSPEQVEAIGGGDIDHGHNILDAFVKHVRKKTVKTLRKLKGPKAS